MLSLLAMSKSKKATKVDVLIRIILIIGMVMFGYILVLSLLSIFGYGDPEEDNGPALLLMPFFMAALIYACVKAYGWTKGKHSK